MSNRHAPPAPPGTLAAADVEEIERQTVFQGYFRIDRYRLRHRLFEGGWSGEMSREVFERGHAVAVLPYDPQRDQVVLIEQFRVGALAAMRSPWFPGKPTPWLIECVAGIIDAGETAEEVARREMREESDCEVLALVPIAAYVASPGGSSETVRVFCARIDAAHAGGIHGMSAEHENIRVHVVAADEAFRWLEAGRITNPMTIIALLWLQLKRDALRLRWRAPPT